MPSQTLIVGTGGSSIRTGVTGGTAWTSPGNITAEDSVFAQWSGATAADISGWLNGTNAGFSIPADATIDGIKVEVKGACIPGGSTVNGTRLIVGGVQAGDDLAAGGLSGFSVQWTTAGGGPTSLWGLTPTPAQVNASDFGAAVSVQNASSSDTAQVDAMKITVYYTEGPVDPVVMQWAAGDIDELPAPAIQWDANGPTAEQSHPVAPIGLQWLPIDFTGADFATLSWAAVIGSVRKTHEAPTPPTMQWAINIGDVFHYATPGLDSLQWSGLEPPDAADIGGATWGAVPGTTQKQHDAPVAQPGGWTANIGSTSHDTDANQDLTTWTAAVGTTQKSEPDFRAFGIGLQWSAVDPTPQHHYAAPVDSLQWSAVAPATVYEAGPGLDALTWSATAVDVQHDANSSPVAANWSVSASGLAHEYDFGPQLLQWSAAIPETVATTPTAGVTWSPVDPSPQHLHPLGVAAASWTAVVVPTLIGEVTPTLLTWAPAAIASAHDGTPTVAVLNWSAEKPQIAATTPAGVATWSAVIVEPTQLFTLEPALINWRGLAPLPQRLATPGVPLANWTAVTPSKPFVAHAPTAVANWGAVVPVSIYLAGIDPGRLNWQAIEPAITTEITGWFEYTHPVDRFHYTHPGQN